MRMKKAHAHPILYGSTVPYDVRSDLNLCLFPQQERTTFVVSSELSDLFAASLTYIQVSQGDSHYSTALELFGIYFSNCL